MMIKYDKTQLNMGIMLISVSILFFIFLYCMEVYAQDEQEIIDDKYVTIVIGIPTTLGKSLPNCVEKDANGDCILPLIWHVDVLSKEPGRASFHLYHKRLNGMIFKVDASRELSGTRYIWLLHGSAIWAKLIVKAKDLMADSTGVVGPKDFAWVISQPKDICELVSKATLVDVTGVDGKLQSIPDMTTEFCNYNQDGKKNCILVTTPQSYPPNSTFRCGMDGKYFLRMSKYGFGYVNDWPDPSDLSVGAPVNRIVPPNTSEEVWMDSIVEPPSKTCYKVPVAISCP